MISVEEARNLLAKFTQTYSKKKVSISEALNCFAAEDVFSNCDVPPFNNSAMDGYAIKFTEYSPEKGLKIEGELAAGINKQKTIENNTAMRIFTGAPVPENADAVIMQEKISVKNGYLFFNESELTKGQNIRLKGSQTKLGDLALKKHTKITANVIGFLSSIGIDEIEIYKKPIVHIIVTGNEIVQPGQALKYGEVYDCNSYSIAAGFAEIGININVFHCKDHEADMFEAIKSSLTQCDLLLITGGVSVGDYDFVVPALEKNGVQKLFHKLKQKPAKPLFAGHLANKFVFGLPGNPASVLTSFYVYVKPFVFQKMGNLEPNFTECEIQNNFKRKAGLTQFLKAKRIGNKVGILEGQESYRMDGFIDSNCLIEIPEEVESYSIGDWVKTINN